MLPCVVIFVLGSNLSGADAAKAGDAKPAATDDEKLTMFEEAEAGYSLRVPSGFSKLSPDESREVFQGISQHFGKQVGERALRRPPAWFRGPVDSNSKMLPPSLAIGYTDLPGPVDPTQIPRYKSELEAEFRKRGDSYGQLTIILVDVGGINALRIEHELLSPVDKSRSKVVTIAIPGHDKRYDVVFNFSEEQTPRVESAIATVVRTFKLKSAPMLSAESQGRWTRVLIWTVGGFAAGILLSFLLKVLSGAGEKVPEKPA